MKTILINPSQNTQYPQPPLGLASIAAVLEQKGHTVEIIDANALQLSEREIVGKVKGADVICITGRRGSRHQQGRYDLSEKRYNCRTFAIDLHLPFKNDPRLIECDATDMPFDNESISKIALHCAYEMFENDADINLINEVNRVLRKGGKMIIIPLYMDHIYHIQSSPNISRKGIVYGKARRVWRDDKYSVRFSRHYSVEAFKERIVDNRDKLNLKIYYFTNENEIKQNLDDRVYVKFAACFTKE